MLLSAKLSYVEASASPSARERERKREREQKYMAGAGSTRLPLFPSFQEAHKNHRTLSPSLSLSASCCTRLCPVQTESLLTPLCPPVCGSSTWLLKEAKSLTIRHRPPPFPLPPQHTHPSPHMHSAPLPHHSITGSKKLTGSNG